MSEEYRGQFKAMADCETCGKKFYGNNAQGVGVQHARRYGHHVVVEIVVYWIYNYSGEPQQMTKRKPRKAVTP